MLPDHCHLSLPPPPPYLPIFPDPTKLTGVCWPRPAGWIGRCTLDSSVTFAIMSCQRYLEGERERGRRRRSVGQRTTDADDGRGNAMRQTEVGRNSPPLFLLSVCTNTFLARSLAALLIILLLRALSLSLSPSYSSQTQRTSRRGHLAECAIPNMTNNILRDNLQRGDTTQREGGRARERTGGGGGGWDC